MSSKLIVVFGATGVQGGSVIKTILADESLSKEYKIRGITRDPKKPAAQELASKGVELVNADLSSRSSVDAALKDAHTVFLVTNFWETMSHETEIAQGKTVADAAKAAGVQHLIFSSLNNITETSKGKLTHVLHFDGKNDVEKYIRSSGVPATFVLPGYYMSNFLQFMPKGEDGVYTLALPIDGEKAQFPLLDTEADMGKFVKPALVHGAGLSGVKDGRILAAVDYYTPSRILEEFEKASGKKTRFVKLDYDTYKTYLPKGAEDELLENHLALEEPGYYAGEDLGPSVKLVKSCGEEVTSWSEFVKKQKVWMQ